MAADKDKTPMGSCSLCGEDLCDGDNATAITTGGIKSECEGFVPDQDSPWLDIWCDECRPAVMMAIDKLVASKKGLETDDVYGTNVIDKAKQKEYPCAWCNDANYPGDGK